jgi:hypothetical protein
LERNSNQLGNRKALLSAEKGFAFFVLTASPVFYALQKVVNRQSQPV